MLVSVPLLFLHVKKFLSPSEEKHTRWPLERGRGREREKEIRVIEIIERGVQVQDEIENQKRSDRFVNISCSSNVQLYGHGELSSV